MNSVVEWRKGVVAHYGSLESFPDTRTVEFMLSLISKDIENELQMRGWLEKHPADLADWTKKTEAEYAEHLEIQKELTEWLTSKKQKIVPHSWQKLSEISPS